MELHFFETGRVISSHQSYEQHLDEIYLLLSLNPEEGSDDAKKLQCFSDRVDFYERTRHAM